MGARHRCPPDSHHPSLLLLEVDNVRQRLLPIPFPRASTCFGAVRELLLNRSGLRARGALCSMGGS